MRVLICAVLLLTASRIDAAALPTGSWAIDSNRSSVRFTVTKFGREVVEGRFGEFGGAIVYDRDVPQRSSLRWRVRAASVATGEAVRDHALRGPDFFDAARFPELTFVSSRIRPLPDGRVHIRGALTIRGKSRPMVVTARLVNDDPRAPTFETHFLLDRHDFGVSGGSVSRHGISDEVSVRLRLVAVRR